MALDFDIDFDMYTGYNYNVLINPTITKKHIEMRNALIYQQRYKTIYMDDRYTVIVPNDLHASCIYQDKKLKVKFFCNNPRVTRK